MPLSGRKKRASMILAPWDGVFQGLPPPHPPVRSPVQVSILSEPAFKFKLSTYDRQLEVLRRTLELMSVGQFLPHPLNAISDVVGRFHAFHVHCVLVDVWNFMKVKTS